MALVVGQKLLDPAADIFRVDRPAAAARNGNLVAEHALMRTAGMGDEDGDDEGLLKIGAHRQALRIEPRLSRFKQVLSRLPGNGQFIQ